MDGKRVFWAAAIALLFVTGATQRANADGTVNDLANWDTINIQRPVTKHINGFFQAQIRINNDISDVDKTLLWGGLGYKVTPKVTLWQGYAWTPSYHPRYTNETRLWQQAQFSDNYRGGGVTLRARLEERMIARVGTHLAFRNLAQYSHPIAKMPRYYGVISDEVFFFLNAPKKTHSGFDQNWAYVGIGRAVTKHANLEIGYLNVFTNRHGTPDSFQHTIFTQVALH